MNILDIISRDIPNGEQVFKDIASHPVLRNRIIVMDSDPSHSDIDQATELLRKVLRNQAPLEELPRANRGVYNATGALYGFRTILGENVPPRPPEDGLLEAVTAYVRAYEAPGSRLRSVDFPVARAHELVLRIGVMRDDLRAKMRHVSTLLQQLSLLENEAHTMVKQPYEILRKLGQADTMLSDLLEDVETYYFGAAKQGASTRKDKERTLDKLKQQAEEQGMAEAQRKARTSLGDELKTIFGELGRVTGMGDERKEAR